MALEFLFYEYLLPVTSFLPLPFFIFRWRNSELTTEFLVGCATRLTQSFVPLSSHNLHIPCAVFPPLSVSIMTTRYAF